MLQESCQTDCIPLGPSKRKLQGFWGRLNLSCFLKSSNSKFRPLLTPPSSLQEIPLRHVTSARCCINWTESTAGSTDCPICVNRMQWCNEATCSFNAHRWKHGNSGLASSRLPNWDRKRNGDYSLLITQKLCLKGNLLLVFVKIPTVAEIYLQKHSENIHRTKEHAQSAYAYVISANNLKCNFPFSQKLFSNALAWFG